MAELGHRVGRTVFDHGGLAMVLLCAGVHRRISVGLAVLYLGQLRLLGVLFLCFLVSLDILFQEVVQELRFGLGLLYHLFLLVCFLSSFEMLYAAPFQRIKS